MKTFPIRRSDGSMFAFEIPNKLVTAGQIARVLRRTACVTNVRCRRLLLDHHLDHELRVQFDYKGPSFVVKEDWGDSSCYWIGPADDLETPSSIDELEPVL